MNADERMFDRWFSELIANVRIPGMLDHGSCALRDVLRDVKPILWLSWQRADPLELRNRIIYNDWLLLSDWESVPGWNDFKRNAFPEAE